VAGNDAKVRIYDENSQSKDFLMTLKANGKKFPSHSKRIFALKFDQTQESILYSSGWDDTVHINDLREGGPVGIVTGTHVCGEAIDVVDNLLIAGNYRNQRNLLLFDLRQSSKPL
jgi:WD40 repeat protein